MKYIFVLMMLINLKSYSFKVVVTGIEERKAGIYMAIFEKDEGFPYEGKKGVFVWTGNPGEAEKGIETALPAGRYAVVVYQDLNDNHEMDRWFWGKPKEPYGLSGADRKLRRRPKFHDGAVKIDSDDVVEVRLWNP